MSTYKVENLQTEGDLDRLIDKGDQIKWDIIGLCETFRKGEGLSEIRAGYWMYEIGKTEGSPDVKGLAFLVHPKIKDYVTDFKTLNRVVKMEVNLQGKDPVTVINAYAPTSTAEDEKVEQFYDVERAVGDCVSKYKIITGDFNAKIGTKTKQDFSSV